MRHHSKKLPSQNPKSGEFFLSCAVWIVLHLDSFNSVRLNSSSVDNCQFVKATGQVTVTTSRIVQRLNSAGDDQDHQIDPSTPHYSSFVNQGKENLLGATVLKKENHPELTMAQTFNMGRPELHNRLPFNGGLPPKMCPKVWAYKWCLPRVMELPWHHKLGNWAQHVQQLNPNSARETIFSIWSECSNSKKCFYSQAQRMKFPSNLFV